MIVAWLLFPLVLLAVCLGLGLAVERIAGVRLPGTVLPSAGLALLIVVASLMTYKNSTAKFTTALVVVLALAGYAGSISRVRDLRPGRWPLALALLLYAVFAAPVVLSGNASWLGYFQLNDAAIHFALINQLLAHGRDLSGVHSSSLLSLLHGYISNAYPVGAQVGLGAIRPLVGQNVAWIFQPYLAVILVLGGLAIYQLLDEVVHSRPLRALCAFVAAQTGLVYGYYLEASIKEIATTWLVTLVVVLVLQTLKQEPRIRRLVPLAIATVAAFDVLNVAIVPWLGVPLAVFAVLAVRRSVPTIARMPRRRLTLVGAGAVIALAAIASPIIATGKTAFHVLSSQLTKHGDLGNLTHALSKWELLGIWPSGDFRVSTSHYPYQFPNAGLIAEGLIGLAVVSALVGTVWALWRRAAGPLLLLAGSGLAAIYLLLRASPYASGKVMMIVSVAIVVMVMLGAAALLELGRQHSRFAAIPGGVLATLLAGGVLWTNVDAYGGARLAPRAEFAELAYIGERFAGQGPAFYNQGDEFAIDFLGPVVPTDPALQPPRPGSRLFAHSTPQLSHAPWDVNELEESYLQAFKLLVIGRSPLGSRPPADYRLAYRGHFFEVWRRVTGPQVLEELPLGLSRSPVSVPPCREVMALARRAAREGARLAYSERADPLLVGAAELHYVGKARLAAAAEGADSGISLRNPGVLLSGLQVPTSGRYVVWLTVSLSRQVQVRIDGRWVGWTSYEIGPPGQFLAIGSIGLAAGAHAVSVVIPNETLAPGERGTQLLGLIALAPALGGDELHEVEPARARSLCGREFDWIEIVR